MSPCVFFFSWGRQTCGSFQRIHPQVELDPQDSLHVVPPAFARHLCISFHDPSHPKTGASYSCSRIGDERVLEARRVRALFSRLSSRMVRYHLAYSLSFPVEVQVVAILSVLFADPLRRRSFFPPFFFFALGTLIRGGESMSRCL